MAKSPIQIYDSAHERAEHFLKSGQSGPKAKDELRAAVVFAVAAIDAFFRAKMIKYLKEQREQTGKSFQLPLAAQKIVREEVAKQTFNRKQYNQLRKPEKELVDTLVESSKSSLIAYLEDALEYESFQSIGKMSEALSVMGKTPSEIWGRFDASGKTPNIKKKPGRGRRPRPKVGKKIDAKIQMERMFRKRHHIVHEADIVLRGRRRVGELRKIEHDTVKKWLEHSKRAIHEINKLIV